MQRSPVAPSHLCREDSLLLHRLLEYLQGDRWFCDGPSASDSIIYPIPQNLAHRQRQEEGEQLTVIRYLMAGPKNPQPAQIVHRLIRAGLGTIHGIAVDLRRLEGSRRAVRNRVGDVEAAEPVTDPVGVAGP